MQNLKNAFDKNNTKRSPPYQGLLFQWSKLHHINASSFLLPTPLTSEKMQACIRTAAVRNPVGKLNLLNVHIWAVLIIVVMVSALIHRCITAFCTHSLIGDDSIA